MNNLQIISGALQLIGESGSALVNLRTGSVIGSAVPDPGEAGVRGVTGRSFRVAPHVIVSPSDLSLSTTGNTFYKITRSVTRDSLSIGWRIDSPGGGDKTDELEVDFLVIGEAA